MKVAQEAKAEAPPEAGRVAGKVTRAGGGALVASLEVTSPQAGVAARTVSAVPDDQLTPAQARERTPRLRGGEHS